MNQAGEAREVRLRLDLPEERSHFLVVFEAPVDGSA